MPESNVHNQAPASIDRLPAGGLKGIAAAAVVFAVFTVATSLYFGSGRIGGATPSLKSLPLDDAYIHLVYATGFLERGLPEYNAGEPEAGMSSILWVLLEALFIGGCGAFGLPAILSVHLLNNLLAFYLAMISFLLVWRIHRSYPLGVLAGVLILFEPALGFSRFAGMEVLLTAANMTAAWYFFAREKRWTAGLFLGLSVLSRLECVVLAGLFLLFEIPGPRRWKNLARLFIPIATAALLWAAYNYAAAGSPLPNTFYAKTDLSLDLAEAGRIIAFMVFRLPYFAWIAGFALYLLGSAASIRRFGVRALPAVIFPWLFILGVACTRVNFSSFWPYVFHRYFQPCLPFLFLPWVGGAGVVAGRAAMFVGQGPGRLPLRLAAAAAAAVIVLSCALPWPAAMRHWRNLLTWNCLNVEEIMVTIGRWIDDNTDPDARVAVADAGAIRYYGKRYTLDLVGLNSKEVLQDPVGAFFRVRPDYLVLPEKAGDPPPTSREWRRSTVGAGRSVWISPVFSAAAERYTITTGYPNRQTVYRISYEDVPDAAR